MRLNNYTTKNYTELGRSYQLVLPLSLVPDDDSVRLLSHELEELDYTLLYQAYSAKGRNPAVDPKTMFKVIYQMVRSLRLVPINIHLYGESLLENGKKKCCYESKRYWNW